MQAQTLDPNSASTKPDEDTATSYQLTEEQYYQQQLLAAQPLQTDQQLLQHQLMQHQQLQQQQQQLPMQPLQQQHLSLQQHQISQQTFQTSQQPIPQPQQQHLAQHQPIQQMSSQQPLPTQHQQSLPTQHQQQQLHNQQPQHIPAQQSHISTLQQQLPTQQQQLAQQQQLPPQQQQQQIPSQQQQQQINQQQQQIPPQQQVPTQQQMPPQQQQIPMQQQQMTPQQQQMPPQQQQHVHTQPQIPQQQPQHIPSQQQYMQQQLIPQQQQVQSQQQPHQTSQQTINPLIPPSNLQQQLSQQPSMIETQHLPQQHGIQPQQQPALSIPNQQQPVGNLSQPMSAPIQSQQLLPPPQQQLPRSNSQPAQQQQQPANPIPQDLTNMYAAQSNVQVVAHQQQKKTSFSGVPQASQGFQIPAEAYASQMTYPSASFSNAGFQPTELMYHQQLQEQLQRQQLEQQQQSDQASQAYSQVELSDTTLYGQASQETPSQLTPAVKLGNVSPRIEPSEDLVKSQDGSMFQTADIPTENVPDVVTSRTPQNIASESPDIRQEQMLNMESKEIHQPPMETPSVVEASSLAEPQRQLSDSSNGAPPQVSGDAVSVSTPRFVLPRLEVEWLHPPSGQQAGGPFKTGPPSAELRPSTAPVFHPDLQCYSQVSRRGSLPVSTNVNPFVFPSDNLCNMKTVDAGLDNLSSSQYSALSHVIPFPSQTTRRRSADPSEISLPVSSNINPFVFSKDNPSNLKTVDGSLDNLSLSQYSALSHKIPFPSQTTRRRSADPSEIYRSRQSMRLGLSARSGSASPNRESLEDILSYLEHRRASSGNTVLSPVLESLLGVSSEAVNLHMSTIREMGSLSSLKVQIQHGSSSCPLLHGTLHGAVRTNAALCCHFWFGIFP